MLVLQLLLAAAIILLGISMLAWPRRFWYLTQGWWAYTNPQDVGLSEACLFWNALQAMSMILVGAVLLLVSLMQVTG